VELEDTWMLEEMVVPNSPKAGIVDRYIQQEAVSSALNAVVLLRDQEDLSHPGFGMNIFQEIENEQSSR
jgi:hypothetical protein